MTSATNELAQQLIGRTVTDQQGSKIGKIGQVYLNDSTGQPEWLTVSTGLFGTRESFVPLRGADYSSGDEVVVPVAKDTVKDAPSVDNDGHLDAAEEETLYQYYAQYLGQPAEYADQPAEYADQPAEYADVAGAGHDTSGPNTDDAMTRSEERLHVGTEQVETGRARLRKYIVTENVTQTVPVSREEVRLEREPITDANRGQALDGPAISEEEHEVTLYAEHPVVAKETVPVERVRLGKDSVTDEHQVDETVRKEQIDLESDGHPGTA
jgi:uncharacterized protein (TIGR02271 family)